ncbi:MAG: thiamine pyrophosphate-dependent enzyme [Propionibacteriaceae bacterium]|nr:thiamine pyrophosphate-dependent enzyme [Propionibacteriaceae bacterium]
MTKSILVNPFDMRARGSIRPPEILMNTYQLDMPAEVNRYGNEGLVHILHDMMVIREFESMLTSIKTTGAWKDISYNYLGPAHLSVGQEATAVGQAAELKPEDLVFGSHRSHGEVLAKCFSASRQMDVASVLGIMEGFRDGDTLRHAEMLPHESETELQANFILFGTLAEIFARKSGFNGGLGGSMHAFFAPFGSMPNNAVVGASAPIAQGAALYKRINSKPGIVVANIGDASVGSGPVWEAMVFAAMDQFRRLWPQAAGGNPPILFSFFNNFYGMGGQTAGETMGYDILARVGAGVNPEAMHAERVDGYNPLAVANAVRRKKEILTSGDGPVLLDLITYRTSGHSAGDDATYRTTEEVALWEQADAIQDFSSTLTNAGILSASQIEEMYTSVVDKLTQVLRLAADDDKCPRVDAAFIESVMFSNGHVEALGEGVPQLLEPLEVNERFKSVAEKTRSVVDGQGKPVSPERMYQYRDGLFEAMSHRFSVDPTMAAWGEDNRDWGGAFGVYRGLTKMIPYNRLFNTPISEAAIVGAGVGYALCGGRAVVELMYSDFIGRAGDDIFNQAAKWQAMSAGVLKMPLVVRVCVGSQYGAQHSQDWSGLVAHIPGLKVYYPATPTDAKGMLNLALVGTDPVIFFESEKLYDRGEEFEVGGVPRGYYETVEGEPAVRREGTDLTIATVGPALYPALEAATTLQEKYGVSAEVLDLRFLVPMNYDKLLESVTKTGSLLLVSDQVERGSFLHTIADTVSSLSFDDLDAPVAVLGARNHITPAAELEDVFFPGASAILDTIHLWIRPLHGHTATEAQTEAEKLRRAAKGV